MAAAFVQAWGGVSFSNSTGGSTGAITTTAGNTLVVVTTCDLASVTVSDSKGNTWLTADGPANNGGDNTKVHYVLSCLGGASHTITIAHALGFSVICAAEYSGIASLNAHNITGTGNSTTLLSSTATTSVDNCMIIGGGNISAGTNNAFTGAGGLTVRSSVGTGSTSATGFLGDKLATAAGGYTASATWSGSAGVWICAITTFAPTGGAVGEATALSVGPGVGPGGPFGPLSFQWQQQVGTDPDSVDLRQGAAVAYLAVGATTAGNKSTDGTAKAAVAASVRQAGTKLTGGSATAQVTVWARQAGTKLISGAANAAVSVFAKQSGVKVGQGNAKGGVGVASTAATSKVAQGTAKAGIAVAAVEAGTKLAQGSAKAGLAVWARAAATKLTGGAGKAAVAVWAPVAGTKVGGAVEGAARVAVAVFARSAGTKIAGGTAKAGVAVETKQSGTKIGSGSSKASVTVSVRQIATKIASGVSKVALAVWSKVAGVAIDLTLGAGTGETYLAGPGTATSLAGPDTDTVVVFPSVASLLASPLTASALVAPRTSTEISNE